MKKLTGFLGFFFKPIRENFLFFLFMLLLGLLSGWLTSSNKPNVVTYPNLWGEVFVDVCLGCIFLTFLPKKIRPWVRGLAYIILYSVAIIDLFCYIKYGATLNPSMLLLVGETNSREAGEFLQTALSADVLFGPVGGIVLLAIVQGVCAFVYARFRDKFVDFVPQVYAALGVITLGLFVWGAIATYNNKLKCTQLLMAKNVGQVEHMLTEHEHGLFYTPITRLAFSIRNNQMAAQQVTKLVDAAGKVQVDSCSYTSPNIVLVIGESVSRHHSQMYGYKMPTTPLQLKREKNGELVRFSDVVAPWNLTSFVFKNLFSMHVVGQEGEWCDYPLFPELFRKAGYHVTFITNQFLPQATAAVYDFSGGFFLNNPTLSEAQFDTRNDQLYKLDGSLLGVYDRLKKENTDHNLTILHLMGQHVNYKQRYAKEQRRFNADDYADFRSDLNVKERSMLAHYDNATLYNDSVLDQVLRRFEKEDAIVIYVPDHGEECYEGDRGFICRNHSATIDYDLAKYEFEIPFWIWASPTYRQKHADVWALVRQAKDRPFMTDRLAHTLLALAGIHSKDYHPEYNVLSPRYDAKRPRILKGTTDYDKLKPKK